MGKTLVVLIHGGPGAAGEMKTVADQLSQSFSVIAPNQTKKTISGQVEELKRQISDAGESPFILVGYSWGAWLGWIFTARYPDLVKKLILISSGPFDAKYVEVMNKVRLSRMSDKQKKQFDELIAKLDSSSGSDKNGIFKNFGELMSRVDSHEVMQDTAEIKYDYEIYQTIWPEADELRNSGKLLKMGKSIKCPVIAIQGDQDTHPYTGVKAPLEAILSDFKAILLPKCGHKPWLEKGSKQQFYNILKEEIK